MYSTYVDNYLIQMCIATPNLFNAPYYFIFTLHVPCSYTFGVKHKVNRSRTVSEYQQGPRNFHLKQDSNIKLSFIRKSFQLTELSYNGQKT